MTQKERSEKYRQELIEMVKASGQEIVDRAEDLVGNGDLISDFEISLRFEQETACPTIIVTRTHINKNAYDIYLNMHFEQK